NGNDAAKDDPTPCRVLGIFGMSKFTNESDLQEIFERFGPVEKIQLIRDPHEGHSRCFGFINMANVDDARRARDELTDSMIHDRKVRVDFSKTNRAHSPTPGKYKGQDTSQLAQQRRRDRQPDRGPRRYGDDRRNGDDRHYGGRRFGDDRRNGDDRRYGGGPGQQSSYNDSRGGAPYRRRPNSRDRRRQDHPYYGGARSRSRSPGYNASPKRGGYDSNRRSTNYGEGGGRSREYDDRRAGGYGGGGRSPQQRSHGQDRGGFGYDQRPAEGRGRSSRGDYQPR
ncbi:transformer 2 beta, partial [Coemansia nantahalensis]